MTQCNATAELMDASMQIIPGITLRCELELGHNVELRGLMRGGRYDLLEQADVAPSLWNIMPVEHPATEHAFTFRWSDPTVDELAEVLDPDESFDLEVDIAPPDVIVAQNLVTSLSGMAPIRERTRTCEHCGSLLGLAAGVWRHPDDDLANACRVGNVRASGRRDR